MDEMRWTFGVEPLDQFNEFASAVRSLTGLVLALEAAHAALERLIATLRSAEADLTRLVPGNPAPRIGVNAASDGRVYLDHARDIGAFNPCFPMYEIRVDGDRATGTVSFPIAYEGPPGLVHGGFLAVFFDSIIQHHNCEVGVAGKTTSLTVTYRRPTPLLTELQFEVERAVEDRRIVSTARLMADSVVVCDARMSAVAGDLSRLPEISPRRVGV
jgi:acyl-coenzyme A thioesterase PaaI-like protein